MKICFVGHEFHRRTRSSNFMIELLGKIGDVVEFYGDPDGSPLVNDTLTRQLAASSFDRYVYWQSELIAERLLPMELGPSFIAPMYDTIADKRDDYWLQFVDHGFLSFTRAHHERLQAIGCRSSYFQYFPDPGPERYRWFDRPRDAFFWERQPRSTVNRTSVLAQCEALGVTQLHIHEVPDFVTDRAEQIAVSIPVTVSRWFDRRDEYDAVAGRPLFFFAPRAREGIGMACLEAMARGQIIVAPDSAATNEYVAHHVSGLLYDPRRRFDASLCQIEVAALRRMSRAARRKAVTGRRTWLEDTHRLLSIVAGDGQRWSTSDSSAAFGRMIRQAAHARRSHGG